jgi:hypothetical protein
MYAIVLSLHNVLRWLVLVAGVLAVVEAIRGWTGARPWRIGGAGRLFPISLDVQFLVGVLLYAVLSPTTRAAFADFGAAMRAPQLRFFAVEHAVLMVLALVAAHLGKVLAPKAADDAGRHRRAAVWYGLALLLVLAGMPWFRPLFRLGT